MSIISILYLTCHLCSGTSPATDGLPGLYDLLVTAGRENPVVGNQDGSYLTMKSNQGLVFGAATILSGFSGIFCDQGYWQRVRVFIAGFPVCRRVLRLNFLWLGFDRQLRAIQSRRRRRM